MTAKSVSVKLDKVRRLRFDYNAFAELDDQFGFNVEDLTKLFSSPEKFSFGIFRKLLWAALLHEEPDMTLQDVGEILDNSDWINRAGEIGDALGNAFLKSSFAKEKAKKKAQVAKPKSGSQKSSLRKATG